jgi:hypothetical protein
MSKWDFPVRGGKSKADRIAELEQQVAELKASTNADIDELVQRGIELTIRLEQAKEWYKERDEIVDQLLECGETQFEQEGVILTLVDNFATTNKAWKSVPLNRFCLEITQGVKK